MPALHNYRVTRVQEVVVTATSMAEAAEKASEAFDAPVRADNSGPVKTIDFRTELVR